MADVARLEQLIAPEADALGFALVRVALISSEAGEGAPALQVMAEDPATGQLTLDQCGELSRRISDLLDAHEERGDELVPGSFHLEVSSPGIDRPLTRLKDFAQWTGHEAKVSLDEEAGKRRNLRGDLAGVDGETITLDDRKQGRLSFPFSSVHSARLVLTDALIAATRPLDASGADIVEEEKAID